MSGHADGQPPDDLLDALEASLPDVVECLPESGVVDGIDDDFLEMLSSPDVVQRHT